MRVRFGLVCFQAAAYAIDIVLLVLLQVCIEIANTLIYILMSDDSPNYVWILAGTNGSISICMFSIFFIVLPMKYQRTIGQTCVSRLTKLLSHMPFQEQEQF